MLLNVILIYHSAWNVYTETNTTIFRNIKQIYSIIKKKQLPKYSSTRFSSCEMIADKLVKLAIMKNSNLVTSMKRFDWTEMTESTV